MMVKWIWLCSALGLLALAASCSSDGGGNKADAEAASDGGSSVSPGEDLVQAPKTDSQSRADNRDEEVRQPDSPADTVPETAVEITQIEPVDAVAEVGVCEPDCSIGQCGPDPLCGEPCGDCPGNESCEHGQCVPTSCWPDCGDEIEIPAGPFWMGCNEAVDNLPGCMANEFPYHQVTLDAFLIDRTEVAQAEYAQCVEAGTCDQPKEGWDPASTPDLPVVGVSWYQAEKYCKWQGRRLPTEAEWEKAARGPDGRIFPWGNEAPTCDLAIFSSCPGKTYSPCSTSPAGDSPYGLCDMAGNVQEWVADYYDKAYYEVSPSENPKGPDDSSNKIARGEGYAYSDVRVSKREPVLPKKSDSDHGFRCARDAAP